MQLRVAFLTDVRRPVLVDGHAALLLIVIIIKGCDPRRPGGPVLAGHDWHHGEAQSIVAILADPGGPVLVLAYVDGHPVVPIRADPGRPVLGLIWAV